MKIGLVFPQTEIGADPVVVREFAQSAEAAGFDSLLAYDHVLGATHDREPKLTGPYDEDSLFHEPMVLFGHLAAVTERIELVTGVLILPQRQTVLVAKQAAEVDRLSNGRLRLGIGVGWNQVEYEGLNENFHDRGKRSEEQIALMRALWTQDVIEFDGRWHQVREAGINPSPVQRPIPVWIGGYVPATMERIGRIGDGGFPSSQPGEIPTDQVHSDLGLICDAAHAAGRNPKEIGGEARISLSKSARDQWVPATEAWRRAGATHLSLITMGSGLDIDAQIDQLRDYRETVGLD